MLQQIDYNRLLFDKHTLQKKWGFDVTRNGAILSQHYHTLASFSHDDHPDLNLFNFEMAA